MKPNPKIVICCLLAILPCSSSFADENSATYSIQCDIGPDVGQSFGSLFESRNSEGRVVVGAGFQDVYNTRFRNDRHTLQFYVRPNAGDERFTIRRTPHPDLDCGVYLFDHDSSIYAWTSVGNNSVRKWDETAKKWIAQLPRSMAAVRSGDGVMRLGDGRLVFGNNKVRYNDRVILTSKDTDYNYYYAHGHLFFYRQLRASQGGNTVLYACPWTPREPQVDLSRAIVFKPKYDREVPFAWGQIGKQALTVSNQGGLYVFEEGKWRTLLEANNQVSYQVYSIIQLYDRLLLAQYPTGNLFEYRGKGKPKQLKGFPPKLPGVSASARECQTTAIYRGELFAGVWPWAEIWRYDFDKQKWHSLGRGFTHPKLTDKQTHPYEQHTKRFRLVQNHWGQRITGMIPMGDELWMSTSAKGTYRWHAKYDFLTEMQRREYGAVLRLKMPGSLSVPIRWNGGKLNLKFQVDRKRMAVYQDGKLLASQSLGSQFKVNLDKLKTKWGTGIFGPLAGKVISRKP